MTKRVGIVANPRYADMAAVVREVSRHLSDTGWSVSADPEVTELLGSELPAIDFDNIDLALSLGGDGTLLRTGRRLGGRAVPVLGINFGRVGFLTAVSRSNALDAIDAFAEGKHTLSRRATLAGSLVRGGVATHTVTALNDVVLHKGGVARVVRCEVAIDGESVGPISADGVVIASPTGSTAYSLSAGGPVVVPHLDAMLVTPICAHSLGVRPLVVHGSSTITVTPVDPHPSDLMVSFDGQHNEMLLPGDTITVQVGPQRLNLVRFPAVGFFGRLRDKLRWGDLEGRD